MEKTKKYDRVIFPPEVIRNAREVLHERAGKSDPPRWGTLGVDRGNEEWAYDSEDEFFADYRAGFEYAVYRCHTSPGSLYVRCQNYTQGTWTKVQVTLPNRPDIEAVFEVFEKAAPQCVVPAPPAPPPEPWEKRARVFIGHGRKPPWRDLKDHLADKHGLQVEAYEMGARAGLTIRDVLDDMLTKSSIAFLVFTGEDEDVEGVLHARENVIHELGLFQGRLGFRRAIVLLEDDVPEFSNITGLQQIRFGRDRIQETFGEVLATIRREFSGRED